MKGEITYSPRWDTFEFEGKKYYVVYFINNYGVIVKQYAGMIFQFLPFIGMGIRRWSLRKKSVEHATGFLVIDVHFRVVADRILAKDVIKLYEIWEFVYIDPYFYPKDLFSIKEITKNKK